MLSFPQRRTLIFKRLLLPPLVFLFLVLIASEAGAIQSIVRTDGELLRIDADNVPLGILLDEFATVARVESMIVDPEVKSVRVTVSSKKDLPDKEAITEILEASGANYAVYGDRNGPFRIFAGNAQGRVAELAPPGDLDLRTPGSDRADPRAPRPSPPPAEESQRTAHAGRGQQETGTPPEYATGFARVAPFAPDSSTPVQGPSVEDNPVRPQHPPGTLEAPQRGSQNRRNPSRASGFSFVATDAASLIGTPRPFRIGAVSAFLALGLVFGLVLVADPVRSDHLEKR